MSSRGPRPARGTGDQTRDRIVQAALATLREEGIGGASARAIGRRGGFNQALIFYHFGSVNDLLLAAVDELSSCRAERYREHLEGVTSLSELVGLAAELHREDSESGHIAILSQVLAGATTAPELKAPLRERFRPWTELVEGAIERVVAGTPYAAVVPVADLAFVVTALFMGIELTMNLEEDGDREESLFRTIGLMATLLEGLMGSAGA
ncbi:MAG: TetR/AcrR family transcriptional regulator [Actinobacteria bacterium]|nr:TetR/AcrR family transcriptional regulator [Actinomycetota bacterium]MBW3650310.1 TetR/AcrR family transcriptional regulator [Actinomycetota bacterium]